MTLPLLPQPLQPGTLLDGRYIIGNLINQGGFGAVYRATDTSESNRPCAIKETYDVSPAARRQALMQAGILFTVKSKNLPAIYDAFEANQRFYLVMQLIEGQTLQQLLKTTGQPCSEQQVMAWLLPIMHILQELHSRNPAVIHRDIKPANIILTPDNTAVLVDFGLTKLHDPNSNTQTIIQAVSEGFSPIEQYTGHTGPQSDIYSLAATIYVLLTNKIPPLSITRSIHDTLVAPRLLNPALSPKLERVLLKALAVNPDQRYQSMQEFAQALQAPAFTAHNDPTIVATSTPSANSRTTSASLPTPSSPPIDIQSIPLPPPPPPPISRPTSSPQIPSAYRAPSAPIYPVSAPYMPSAPPGYVLVPQSTLASLQPLPSAFGQGCLWGLIQGVLAAVILLILKKDAYFYFATTVGFLFYLFAGYMTTRKGGSFTRGAWAGLWSGVTSTVIFWIVLAIGLLVLVSQQIQTDKLAAQEQGAYIGPNELTHAFRVVAPTILLHPTTQSQSAPAAIIIYLVAGAIIAILFGLAGGILGKMNHHDNINKQKSP
jgi:serine/threonine protein kinase